MERKRSRDGAMESQPNDLFTDGAMLVLNFKLHTWRITVGMCPELPRPIRLFLFRCECTLESDFKWQGMQ
jgi:hypothetical protein